MEKDKLKVALIIAMVGVVAMGAVFAMLPGDLDLSTSLMIIGATGLSIGALYFARDKMSDMRKGLPTEDELSKKVMHKAGALAYYFTVWLAVAILWLDSLYFEDVLGRGLTTGEIIGAIVLIPGLFFIASAIVIKKTGRV